MRVEPIYEPHRVKDAIFSGLLLAFFFFLALFTGAFKAGAPPPAAMRVSLVPSITAPAIAAEVPEPEPAPEPEPEPKPEDIAEQKQQEEQQRAAEQQAEVMRAEQKRKRQKKEEEKRQKEQKEQEKRDKIKREKDELQKKREEKQQKLKEEEEKKRQEEERKKREKELAARKAREAAAAAEAQRLEALEKRALRVADTIAGLIRSRVDDYLKTPASVPFDSDIVVVVQVRLNKDGSLIGFPEVIESSGFPEYDDAALRAVLQASPLPMPQDKFILENDTLLQPFLEHRLYITPN